MYITARCVQVMERCLLMFTTSLAEMPYLQMPLAEVVNKKISLILLCTTTVAHTLALCSVYIVHCILHSRVGVSIHMPSYDSVYMHTQLSYNL